MKNVIEAKELGKRYRIGHSLTTLRDVLRTRDADESNNYHWAVKDVSFSLKQGDGLGIIGPNGAGKTTILKLLSQITKPTTGTLALNGRFSALIELGAGFHPDLTGRENVFLNASILGMGRKEIAKRFDQIVDFAGIEKFIDTPVKRYSSGMYARLGFAIAAHVEPQILLVDEVLAVGDYSFQQKCYARMDQLRENGTTLIFISHNLDAMRRVCNRGLVMYQGHAIYQGDASAAIVAYSDAVRNAARELELTPQVGQGLSQLIMTFDAEIERVQLFDANGVQTSVIQSGSSATVGIDICCQKPVENPVIAFVIRTSAGERVYVATTRWLGVESPSLQAGERCHVRFNFDVPLLNGEYYVGANVGSADLTHYYDRIERALTFRVVSDGEIQGIVDLNANVAFEIQQAEAK